MKTTFRLILFMVLCCTQTMAETLKFTFEFPPETLSITAFQGYDRVEMYNAALMSEDEPGHPWLPARYVNILLPAGALNTSFSVNADEMLFATNVFVLPAQPPQPLSMPVAAFTQHDENVYQLDEKMPMEFAVSGTIHLMRGHSFLPVRLNPVRYNPVRRELFLTQTMTVTVECAPAPLADTPAFSPAPSAVFDEMLRGLVVNPEQLPVAEPAGKDMPAGTKIYQGHNQVYEHTGLTPGQPYFYTIWTSHDGVNFIEPE